MLFTSYFPNPDLLRSALLAWYSKAKRDLPWRRDCTPYRVWISEIMLQQTQMSRGTAFFERWMRRFPDLQSLASASEEEVLRAWEGLGYYSRARNILKTARLLAARSSPFPDNVRDLLKLPGIGTYTASAIASIACNADVACVDANVERVLSRLCDLDLPIRSKEGRSCLAELAEGFLTLGRAGEHNQAMMELGALICGKKPLCQDCPLAGWCLAKKNNTVLMRPVLPAPKGRIPLHLAGAIVLYDSHVLLIQRSEGSVWGGLWAFPCGEIKEGEEPSSAAVRIMREAAGIEARIIKPLAALKTAYTRYNVTTDFFLLCPGSPKDSPDQPSSFWALPAPASASPASATASSSSSVATTSATTCPASPGAVTIFPASATASPLSATASASSVPVAAASTLSAAVSAATATAATAYASFSASAASSSVAAAATVAAAPASAPVSASSATAASFATVSATSSAQATAYATVSAASSAQGTASAAVSAVSSASPCQGPSSSVLPCRWASYEELADLPMPPVHKKAGRLLLGKKA